ncbi:hypothetical protein [Shewanella sp. UCD-KL21]|uniref:hypothetical protein n=1 Tax=Shewanella sp. UCD-KL21 TaxID=1917164 RepID=UPI000970BD46|nr:hypothetical protein [Shewanella sp. UCD-KL21]
MVVINQLVSKLKNDATEISITVANILEQTRDNAELYYEAYLSNENKTPFPRLNNTEQSFELLLANWSISAYLSHADKSTFSTLFTERFKANEAVNMDRATDAALSQLIYMPAYFAMMDITKGYENIQRAYSGLLPNSKHEYQFSDALHSINFKYEKGAWRLDKVSQVAINHYEQ